MLNVVGCWLTCMHACFELRHGALLVTQDNGGYTK